MNDYLNESKLLVVILNDNKGNYILDAMRKAGVSGCTKIFGKTCDEAKAGGLPSVSKNILLSVVNENLESIIDAISNATLLDLNLEATLILIDVFNPDFKVDNCLNGATDRSIQMESKMNLIVTIVNRNNTDELMSAARKAGAQGGTIVNARGTGTEDDAFFFGVSLAPEKEMLLILAKTEDASQIVEAIKNQPIFNERGAGIVFTLNVEKSFSFNAD